MAEVTVTPHLTGGALLAVDETTVEYLDLTAYARSYVKIYCENNAIYFGWAASASITFDLTQTAAGTTGVPDRLDAGGTGTHCKVDLDEPFLCVRAVDKR